MIRVKCFTSMHKEYYDSIGRLMIASWSKFWPEDCKLYVYQEGFEIDKFRNVEGISWEENCLKDWTVFAKKMKGPAVRFAKKGFAMIAGMKNIDSELLIWIDADSITTQPFPKNKIESILSKDKLIAFFDTYYQYNPNYTKTEYLSRSNLGAIESGFVVINKTHPQFSKYLENYEYFYKLDNHDPQIVGEWFDGNICYSATTGLREHVVDLSQTRTTNKTQTPINRSWIGEYVYHAKAKQKHGLDLKKIRNDLNL